MQVFQWFLASLLWTHSTFPLMHSGFEIFQFTKQHDLNLNDYGPAFLANDMHSLQSSQDPGVDYTELLRFQSKLEEEL